MAIVTRSVTLTRANLDYGHIYPTGCIDIFPPDAMGGANKSFAAPRTVQVDFGSGVVDTDIVEGKRIFRGRSWVREFLTQNTRRQVIASCWRNWSLTPIVSPWNRASRSCASPSNSPGLISSCPAKNASLFNVQVPCRLLPAKLRCFNQA
jgi:hypothetical protein